MYGYSFRQPDNVNDEEEEERSESDDSPILDTESTPNMDLPASLYSQDAGEEAISARQIPSKDGDLQKISPTASVTSLTDPDDLPSNVKRKRKSRWKRSKPSKTLHQSKNNSSSFVTALEQRPEVQQNDENIEGTPTPTADEISESSGRKAVRYSGTSSSNGGLSRPIDELDSRTSLLPHGRSTAENSTLPEVLPQTISSESSDKPTQTQRIKTASTGLVRFNVPDESDGRRDLTSNNGFISLNRRAMTKSFHRTKLEPGEVVKVEKMLVRVDFSMRDLPPDYDENDSQKIESGLVQKWREFVVVCRKSTEEDYEFVLQMYKSRVIPAMESPHVSKRSEHVIPLMRKSTKVNMFSSLDKTVVIWRPWGKGTRTYILRPQSSATSIEWYTFLRGALGYKRSGSLQVTVPDLNVTLELSNPFKELEIAGRTLEAQDDDAMAIMKTMTMEKAVVGTIIKRCMEMLEKSPDFADVVSVWLKHEKMGLAWKRYDRLEWIHGANEQKMYGTLAMRRTHDLELRPKHHYPTTVINDKQAMEEPAPVEGFLVRLTSQNGRHQRFGQKYSKRLYFTTNNQYLCYCRPAKAIPPAPPKLEMGRANHTSDAEHFADRIPLIYAVNPYPVDKGRIIWIKNSSPVQREQHDRYAYDEGERRVNMLLQTEAHVNLCHVIRVQHVQSGDPPVDDSEQAAEPDEDAEGIPGDTNSQDEVERSFELVMKNGLAMRLLAYDKVTKKEWMTRLRQIIKYWKVQSAHDTRLYQEVRQENLERLRIDEQMESTLGQFARKWEVSRSVASPQLFNMCGISCCRAITISGVLYRKPRLHSSFNRCSVILCHGQLLMFQSTVRKPTGKEIPHIHHERQQTLDLKECYIYSGLITEGDLLYQDQTFDGKHPGHHALPRIYRNDGWTSQDEDTMTCFVIWHGKRKSFFMANAEGSTRKLRYVSRLGVTGRSITFKTRSRAERDLWVMSIGMEIERLHQKEEVRVVPQK